MERLDKNTVTMTGRMEWVAKDRKFILVDEATEDTLYDFWSCGTIRIGFSNPSKSTNDRYKVTIEKIGVGE